jgi:hypothetical protein
VFFVKYEQSKSTEEQTEPILGDEPSIAKRRFMRTHLSNLNMLPMDLKG